MRTSIEWILWRVSWRLIERKQYKSCLNMRQYTQWLHNWNEPPPTSMGNGLCCSVWNSFVASADIWKRWQKFGILDFESKLFDVLSVRICGGGGGGSVDNPFVVECFGGVVPNSIFVGLTVCTRFGSATAVAYIVQMRFPLVICYVSNVE